MPKKLSRKLSKRRYNKVGGWGGGPSGKQPPVTKPPPGGVRRGRKGSFKLSGGRKTKRKKLVGGEWGGMQIKPKPKPNPKRFKNLNGGGWGTRKIYN